jgi:hypothetical protein
MGPSVPRCHLENDIEVISESIREYLSRMTARISTRVDSGLP